MQLFNRKYRLTIGQPIIAGSGTSSPSVPYRTLAGQISNELDIAQSSEKTNKGAVILTEHNVSFDIEKVSAKSVNSCVITIHNPSDDTMSFLQDANGKKPLVMLEAGYEGGMGKIFLGNLMYFVETFLDENRVVDMHCGDGSEVVKAATFVKSYPKGTANASIVKDMVATFGLPVAKDLNSISGVTNKAHSFSGRSMEEANRFLTGIDFVLSIQDMSVFVSEVVAQDLAARTKSVPYITPAAGQIGSISFLDDSANSTATDSDNNKVKRGVRIVSLLRHEILPTQLVAADLKGTKTTFRVTKVTHSGGYEDNEWQTEIEAEEVL